MITDAELCDRVDTAIAIDRALNAAERGAFLTYCLRLGGYGGATIADWIDEARNADHFAGPIDQWWRRAGDTALAYLMTLHELPEPLTRQLLSGALYAVFGIASATLDVEPWAPTGRRTHVQIASGAALWARGYGEALGWQPHRGQ
jgi:hypothetical protein